MLSDKGGCETTTLSCALTATGKSESRKKLINGKNLRIDRTVYFHVLHLDYRTVAPFLDKLDLGDHCVLTAEMEDNLLEHLLHLLLLRIEHGDILGRS